MYSFVFIHALNRACSLAGILDAVLQVENLMELSNLLRVRSGYLHAKFTTDCYNNRIVRNSRHAHVFNCAPYALCMCLSIHISCTRATGGSCLMMWCGCVFCLTNPLHPCLFRKITLTHICTCINIIYSQVNISNTWTLPQEGYSVFYRFFRDKISWFEADAVCQFHHANLVTGKTTEYMRLSISIHTYIEIHRTTWI